MNIAHALRSLKQDWTVIVTSSGFAVVILVCSYVPLGKSHPWLPWLVFVCMWSFSWAWAFVRSFNREYRKMFLLTREFVIPEMNRVRHEASSGQIIFSSEDAETDFYFERLNAASRGIERDFLKELIQISKTHTPIASGIAHRPRVWRLPL